ncbi:MAG: hypothetical protein PVS2B3_08830 [Steroidobacteraceae bacterium]
MAATSFKETTVNRNQLFSRAVIAAALVVTLPAHAQLLGGGMHGGLTSMQGATVGGGFGTVHGTGGGDAEFSANNRAERIAGAGARDANRAAGHAATDASMSGQRATGAAQTAASRARDGAQGTAGTAEGSVSAIGAAGVTQSESQSRTLDVAGSGASALSFRGTPAAKPEAGDASKPSTAKPQATRPNGAGAPRHPDTQPRHGGDTPRGGTTHGGTTQSGTTQSDTNAGASASASASATG